MNNKITYLIPCYFNELNIPITTSALIECEKLFDKETKFEYILIDDGSKDGTLTELLSFKKKFPDKVKIVKLSGNFGTFNAILAGMDYSTGDCNVILSADLQDPLELIPKMFDYWQKGIKLVIANRENREDPLMQRLISNFFHNAIRKFALKHVPKGGFDLILFDKKILKEIKEMNQHNTHLIYLISWLKYDYISIPYTRRKRKEGTSRWTLSKKIKLFIDTFVSFSYLPLRLISITGIILGLGSIIYAIIIVFKKLNGDIPIEGWAANMVVFLFISSFQMIAIGILGEYLWRTLDSARKRPNYIIEETFE
jgi:dolichol-phosphate mannosyltransferase